MSSLREPRFETRRRAELRNELLARAKAWLPDWRPLDYTSDFAGALLEIVARLESEVAQRLDKMPEKMFRDFLTWLGVRGQAAQAARLPLVFNLAPNSESVLGAAPIQVQASPPPSVTASSPEPVTFETEEDLMIVPGTLAALYAVDPADDAFYKAPDGFSSLNAQAAGPTRWTVKTTAKAGSSQIQLDPALGLDARPTLLHRPTNQLFRVTKVQGDLVTVDPPVGARELQAKEILELQTTFDPFGDARHNLQEHAVYIGSESLLNLPTAARIGIQGITASNIKWSYWGKSGTSSTIEWQPLSDPVQGQDLLQLSKGDGSIEISNVGGKNSRWLKGTVPAKAAVAMKVSNIALVVNPQGCEKTFPCPPAANERSKVAVEGIANTTPLVFDTAFYPLGREPRLFDAFYLGCPEAFSKPNASVKICLEAQDGTAVAFSAAQSTAANTSMLFFGIGKDGFLHRMRQQIETPLMPVKRLPAVQPPINQAGKPNVNTAPAPLKKQGRLSILSRDKDALVSSLADSGVWIWSENPDPSQAGTWYFLGEPSRGATSASGPRDHYDPSVLLLSAGTNIHVVTVSSGILYQAVLAQGWELAGPVQWNQVPHTDKEWWVEIAPIFDATSPYKGAVSADGWLGVTKSGEVFHFTSDDGQSRRVSKKLARIDPLVRPLAVRRKGAAPRSFLFVAKTPTDRQLEAWTVSADAGDPKHIASVAAEVVGNSFDWSDGGDNGLAAVFANEVSSGVAQLAAWFPNPKKIADQSMLYVSKRIPGLVGSPAVAPGQVAAPGGDASIVVLKFDGVRGLKKIEIDDTQLATALVVRNASDHPKQDDVVVTGESTVTLLDQPAHSIPGDGFWIKVPGSEKGKEIKKVSVYRGEAGPFKSSVAAAAPKVIPADKLDLLTHKKGDRLLVTAPDRTHSLHTIEKVQTGTKCIVVEPEIRNPGKIQYSYVHSVDLVSPALLPLIDDALTDSQVSNLAVGGAYFPGGKPAPNPLLSSARVSAKLSAVFQSHWTTAPVPRADKYHILSNVIFDQLAVLADNKATNPSLSWEYFDGRGWRTLPLGDDTTSSLRSTGVISFCVPTGLQATEVAGRNSFWIRARLVGGDYGQETVTVHTVPDSSGRGTTQTVDRSLSSVSPPILVSVNLWYSLCCRSNPDYVLTSDGGELRDQTVANTADVAQVVLFTSLPDSIEAHSSSSPEPGRKDRAIYLGFDAEFSGGPINVMFFADDQNFGDNAFPMRADVLSETGFEHLIPDDGTRALGETGILSFYLASAPPAISLFGPDPRRWLRLRPSARLVNSADTWKPRIRAAYLNGVFARASETQPLERLGSSDGSPNQVVTLARAPVLQGSLELRVLEPLGDEDVQALLDADPNSVLKSLSTGQLGPWVLWKEIDVLEKAAADDRRYSLNSDTGQITFGDGKRGRIPPIGTDSIVAITYKRGGGAAANKIEAWSQINLISPVQGVQQVVAPDDAAGGSDAQTADEVIRFAPAQQYMRDRALSLRDFETLAVESSRDIVQVRALPSAAGIRLVAVTRQPARVPTEAQWRALLSYLADRASPLLAAPNAIARVKPRLVQLKIDLTLTVRSIEFSGAVELEATTRILNLLDPATGGLDKQGWRLGSIPGDTDIAAVLIDTPNLEAIENVSSNAFFEQAAVQKLRPEDLPVASTEDIRIQFKTADIEVGT